MVVQGINAEVLVINGIPEIPEPRFIIRIPQFESGPSKVDGSPSGAFHLLESSCRVAGGTAFKVTTSTRHWIRCMLFEAPRRGG